MSKRLIEGFTWFLRYRGCFFPWLLANIYLLSIIPFSWLYYDVRYYYEWIDIVWGNGYTFIYSSIPGFHPTIIVYPTGLLYIYVYATKASYPPIPILLFITTHSIASSITSLLPLIRVIDKLPLVIAFNIIYYLLKKYYGWKAGLLWLLSHFSYMTIYSYHSDLLAALFLLLGYIAFVKHNNYVKTSFYTALAALVKPLVVVVALIPFIVLYRSEKFKELILYVVIGFLTVLIFTLPYLLVDPWSFMYKSVFFHMNRYPQEYSLWAIPIYAVNYDVSRIPTWIKYVWSPIFFTLLTILYIQFIKLGRYTEKTIVKYYLLVLLVSLIVNKVGNVNYFIWLLPLLVIYTVLNNLYRDKKYLLLYIFISIIIVLIAPLTTFYTAFVVQGSVFVIEDLSYYSATDLARRSFDPHTIQFVLAEFLRRNAYWFFSIMYRGINVSYIIYSVIYNLYLFYLFKTIIRKE